MIRYSRDTGLVSFLYHSTTNLGTKGGQSLTLLAFQADDDVANASDVSSDAQTGEMPSPSASLKSGRVLRLAQSFRHQGHGYDGGADLAHLPARR